MTKSNVPPNDTSYDLVLGAGGVQGPVHIGVRQCLEERHVRINKYYGASVGALIATFMANGYNSKQLREIFLSEGFRFPNWDITSKCLHTFNPLWFFFPWSDTNAWVNRAIDMTPWAIDFKPWLQHVVNEFKLKPQPNLVLVAANAFNTETPVTFEGSDYDLVEGLAASTAAISGLGIRPVWHAETKQLLIDGFYYHPIPAMLCEKRAIVSKIGLATEMPRERLSPSDLFMHMREMMLAPYFNMKFPDPTGHIIIESGLSHVASTNFGVSVRTLEEMVEHGYKAACSKLDEEAKS